MTSLTLVRRIAARPSIVFDALTTPDGIACWWGPDAGPVLFAEADVRVGGPFRVRFRMLDGSEHESSGEYTEVVKPTRLAMTWRWTHGGDPAESGGESLVEIASTPQRRSKGGPRCGAPRSGSSWRILKCPHRSGLRLLCFRIGGEPIEARRPEPLVAPQPVHRVFHGFGCKTHRDGTARL